MIKVTFKEPIEILQDRHWSIAKILYCLDIDIKVFNEITQYGFKGDSNWNWVFPHNILNIEYYEVGEKQSYDNFLDREFILKQLNRI